ncbi:MAG: alpha/beta hydrolase [Erysipelotrichaceae bacterium]|nr:alpha/beta hydrolase [Erysipelotrichaceae bacterium]
MKLTSKTIKYPTRSGERNMIVLQPENVNEKLPAILWIHGGGYITGMSAMVYMSMAKLISEEYGAIVFSPEYRLAPKYPFPAGFDDCCDALKYIFENADSYPIDLSKVIVGGESAGGGLAASVCLYNRDVLHYPVMLQLPLYPMLDCFDTESSKDNHGHVWNTKKNHYGWEKYLGKDYREHPVSKYASVMREANFENLPPCYTYVEDGEPFYSETLQYVENLKNANVPAKADIYHGKTHAFDLVSFLPNAETARQTLLIEVGKYLRKEEK